MLGRPIVRRIIAGYDLVWLVWLVWLIATALFAVVVRRGAVVAGRREIPEESALPLREGPRGAVR